MKLIDPSKGQPHWGVIAMPVDCVNYQDFDLRSMMDAPLPRWRRRWAFNQFQFYGVMGPDWVAGIAWVDLKLVANCFYYVYDFRTQRMHEASWLQPFALGSHMDVTPDRGQARFRQPGVEALMQVVNGRREIRVKDRRGVSLALDIEEPAPASVLRVCSPSGYGRWAYTQKMAGLPVRGEIRWGDTLFTVTDACRASIDWSCGFMRRETFWNWACLAGVVDGRSVGLNLSAGVNDTGVTENAFWIDGRRFDLTPATFTFDRYDPRSEWHVRTADGRADLYFTPRGQRAERVNAGVMASNFRQYAGEFRGTLRDTEGNSWCVDGLHGYMEDHFARW